MNLTREQAIEEHRKMYNEMADEIEKNKRSIKYVAKWKEHYINEIGFLDFNNDCFLCQYTIDKFPRERCEFTCPLMWGEKLGDTCMVTEYGDGLFRRLLYAESWQEQAALASQIANLPEREDD